MFQQIYNLIVKNNFVNKTVDQSRRIMNILKGNFRRANCCIFMQEWAKGYLSQKSDLNDATD